MAHAGASVVRWVALALLALVALLQLKLWTGQGAMPEVWRLQSRLEQQAADNERLRARNAALAADVEDLKTGQEAVEERARSELGMVKPDEEFYQVVEPQPAEPAPEAEAP